MIETTRLADIPVRLDLAALLKMLRIDQRPSYAERCTRLTEQAMAIARPKALYGLAPIDTRTENEITIDRITLTSRVLAVNVQDVHRVFPFVVTCGTELDHWAHALDDMLERFWADAMMQELLLAALNHLKAELQRRFQIGHTAMMNPGSLADWPIEQQAPLFHMLGDVGERIGVKLTDSFIMTPIKSVSGLLFPTAATYENCQLCPREACPGRRAPYDPSLYEQRYSSSAH